MVNKSLKAPEEYVLPVQPKTPPVAETMGAGAQTPVYNETTAVKQLEDTAALQNAVQQGTAPAQNQPQTAAQGQEKAYTMEQLEAFQQEMSAQDKAEMQALGQTIYRAGKYTNTPSATTIRLATPIDGMWYYDYGEKQYLNKWNTTPQGGNAPQATPGQTSGGIQPEGTSGVGAPVQGAGDLTSLLEEWKKAAAEQANGQIDYAVEQAITQLERALEDSKGMYKEQAESVARDEMQALDNSALYAEMRGDKGGIGQSQYNEIQAAAAQNRLTVQQAQTKLATDTARQIADLRAQGEFEKADKALEITQQYLSQLINLEQWAAEFGLSQAQFEASLYQWKKEYDLAMAEFDYNVATNKRDYTASMAEALMAAGVPLDDAQLKALGWSRDQYNEYLRQQELKKAAEGAQNGGGETPTMSFTTAKQAAGKGVFSKEVLDVLRANGYDDEMLEKIYGYRMSGEKLVTVADLGTTAKSIYDKYYDENLKYGKVSQEAMAKLVEEAYMDVKITEDEANFLLDLAGVPREV